MCVCVCVCEFNVWVLGEGKWQSCEKERNGDEDHAPSGARLDRVEGTSIVWLHCGKRSASVAAIHSPAVRL